MTLIRWEPVGELNTIQNEMNRLFNTFFDQPASGRGPGNGGPGNGSPRWIPAMDLVETGDHYVLRADLPGLSEDDVNVQLQDNMLTISGHRQAKHDSRHEGYYRLERAFGGFSRSLTLPDGVDADGVHAHFDRGVLEIRIPKPEQKKPRQVQISLDGRSTGAKTIESTETPDPKANSRDPAPALA
jgi:HSP20 family protein